MVIMSELWLLQTGEVIEAVLARDAMWHALGEAGGLYQ